MEASDASLSAEEAVVDTPVEELEKPTPSPPHSNGEVDVILQLQAWKERGEQLEKLLTVKNAKLQEMEETEVKLKRLLAMAKRSIDNSKQEAMEKDERIQTLQEELSKKQKSRHTWVVDASTRDPKKIWQKVAHGKLIWCLVEYADENDMDELKEFAWHCFNNEEEIQAYANRATGEPLMLPDFSMMPYEVERVKKSLEEEIDRVQEEFRRYRVRSEIARKQKDAEIRKMNANVMAKQTEQIAEIDILGELQLSKAQIRRLAKAQAEAEERESEWRRKFEKLMKDYEKLSGTMGETALAMEWRERYEHTVREKQELEKRMEELKLMSSGAFGSWSDSSNGDLQMLRQESAQHRKRALNAAEQKESNSVQLHYHENGGGSGISSRSNSFKDTHARRLSGESNSSLSGFETPNATKTNEYLKNIIYKYMASDQHEAKEHMEKAIATILNFTPSEITALQEKRKQTQGWFW
ncbi:GRIP [Plasmopara halstedii]|uniref:GRIP n=1 Tax=Plasmopara halstedii TaxID=4781 RepID=A0A0P1ADN9_PLAHL|nr:GRIP [Plasmopara halstedii]CEG38825.1 GRIP [Plasmopara halstedii]|eukprot:XP_024575194.1 GRIP [Plasmopara halstedii]